LATVFPTSPGFTKGKHPTFRVEANNIDEGVTSAMDAEQVLQYVKKTHGADEFNIEYSITDHPQWELKNIPLSQLNLDPDGEQQDPYNRTNWVDYDVVRDLMPKIVQVLESKPIVVDSDGWIIDGNHRAMAAMEAGLTAVPALVPAEVNENVADGENPVKFTVSSPDGYQHSFQITLAVHGKHVGHFNFVRSADTDDVNNEAEVEQRWQGQGYGKLLLMKAIDVANNHGLDFQQDIRGITDAQQNVYDSLENAGLIVTPGDGFWFLTPQGEQELNGLNENFADGKNPGRKGLSKRVGVNTKASVSSLRKTAKNSSGEKQRMAHWLANMKAGKAKARRK
jgi:GNAT superfamily N-acetyltransferase